MHASGVFCTRRMVLTLTVPRSATSVGVVVLVRTSSVYLCWYLACLFILIVHILAAESLILRIDRAPSQAYVIILFFPARLTDESHSQYIRTHSSDLSTPAVTSGMQDLTGALWILVGSLPL